MISANQKPFQLGNLDVYLIASLAAVIFDESKSWYQCVKTRCLCWSSLPLFLEQSSSENSALFSFQSPMACSLLWLSGWFWMTMIQFAWFVHVEDHSNLHETIWLKMKRFQVVFGESRPSTRVSRCSFSFVGRKGFLCFSLLLVCAKVVWLCLIEVFCSLHFQFNYLIFLLYHFTRVPT